MRDSTKAKLDRPAHDAGQDHAALPGDGAHLRLLPRPAHNLPVQLSSFIGRARESAEIAGQLSNTRLLTLTGPGGGGKTRLALAVAEEVAGSFADGVCWVELAALVDPAFLPQAVARALGIGEQPRRPLVELLVDHLRSKRLLLLLDNCEHLVADCAALADTLLRACAHLRIMTTSREALRIGGEVAWPVPPLAVPDPCALDALARSASIEGRRALAPAPRPGERGQARHIDKIAESEAVQLFVIRAAAVQPSFHLAEANAPIVAQICRRLDGFPLAIELAAARVQVLPLDQIARRLDQSMLFLTLGSRTALPRHQTLRSAIEWSYELLSRSERALFRRLAIFAGSFALDAVEAICRCDDIAEDAILDLLAHLASKSLVLVLQQEARYRLLEPVRQYAKEQLRASGDEAALRARYRDWYIALAERAEQELRGPEQAIWLDRLEAELDNLRAVLQGAAEHQEAEPIARLGSVLWEFWSVRGYASEGRQWLDAALAHGRHLPTPLLARVLCAAGWLAFGQGDYARATALLEQSRDHGRTIGDERGVAEALSFLGLVAFYQNDQVGAAALYEESLALYQEVGDKRGMAEALLSLAEMKPSDADDKQITLLEQGLALFREVGDKRGIAWALNTLGEIAQCQGDYGRAMVRFEESLALFREVGSKRHIALLSPNLAYIIWQRGDIARAVALLTEGLALAWDLGSKRALALGLIGLSEVLAATGEPARASRLLGASEMLLQSTGASLVTTEQIALERSVSAARARLDPAAFDAAWGEGRRIQLEHAIADALAVDYRAFRQSGIERRGTAPYESGIGKQVRPALSSPRPAQAHIMATDASCPAELRIYALGPARVERCGQVLNAADWGYAQPRDLLFYLLCHGRRTKEQVGLDFWPDAASAQLRSNFHRTLHHIRQALGHADWVVRDQGGYAFNRALPYWYDVEAFEAHLHAARQIDDTQPSSAIRHLEQAINLYQGDFLQECAADWHLPRQRALRERYQEALLLLGELLSAEDRHSEAAEIYRRAIDHDNLLEEAHRALMRSYARQGERGQALRHYQSLVETLQAEIGADPAPETTALYQQLRRGDAVV
jgi:predicted ATPase/DNA-binding SARP family transcriptional activator